MELPWAHKSQQSQQQPSTILVILLKEEETISTSTMHRFSQHQWTMRVTHENPTNHTPSAATQAFGARKPLPQTPAKLCFFPFKRHQKAVSSNLGTLHKRRHHDLSELFIMLPSGFLKRKKAPRASKKQLEHAQRKQEGAKIEGSCISGLNTSPHQQKSPSCSSSYFPLEMFFMPCIDWQWSLSDDFPNSHQEWVALFCFRLLLDYLPFYPKSTIQKCCLCGLRFFYLAVCGLCSRLSSDW